MSTTFGILFSVKIAHSYYTNQCADFEFVIPPDTSFLSRRGKILTRTNNGIFYALIEKDEAGVPLIPVTDQIFRIGLQLKNPLFSNFTRQDFKTGTTPLYRNLTSPTNLDALEETILTGSVFSHQVSRATRPVTVILEDLNETVLKTVVFQDNSDSTPVSIDLTTYPSGIYTITEKYNNSTKKFSYCVDPNLTRQQVYAIVEIKIANSFYSPTPPVFSVRFYAKEETLKYYVVGKNYSSAELSHLSVTDAGYNEDARPQLQFTRISQGGFAANDISPSLLTDSTSKVVLFKSQSPVSRLEKPRTKIQLNRNSDLIVKHLPLPGINKSTSDIIIQISKP